MLGLLANSGEKIVYENDFNESADDHWSSPKTAVIEKGDRHYLGAFGPEKISLSLNSIPEHEFIRIEFDLMLMNSWDGTGYYGPDIWQLVLGKDRRLIHASFNNCGFICRNNRQSFPDNYRKDIKHKCGTGAAETRTMGIFWQRPGIDSVYHFDLTFAHKQTGMTLNFTNFSADTIDDQYWGLDNVKISTVDAPPVLTEEELAQLWQVLNGQDPVKAFAAKWKMATSPQETLKFIEDNYHILSAADFAKLIVQLNAEKYREREAATKLLIKHGGSAIDLLQQRFKAMSSRKNPESYFRLKKVLNSVKPQKGKVAPVEVRVTSLLEIINTPEAKELLKRTASVEEKE